MANSGKRFGSRIVDLFGDSVKCRLGLFVIANGVIIVVVMR